jgi:hypothetical protein
MDSSIKTLTITGSAASISEVKKSRRASRRKKVEEDTLEESEPIQPVQKIQIQKTSIASAPSAPYLQPVAKVQITPKVPLQQVQAVEKQELKPGTLATSVILNPPKVQRIKLQPKVHVQHVQKQVAGTRKARRISLSVSNLNNRFTRAKRVHDNTQKSSIDTIRSYLVDKGVIQMKSKAPEKMLRSMYNDFNMLKDGQAL